MNASGRPNTCKSNGIKRLASYESGARVRNTYATYLQLGDSLPKGRLIPHNIIERHRLIIKLPGVEDGHASD
jgi:hypothetical protein